jgi:hypothetical protein
LTDWDYLYAQIVAATGWNWAEIDALTIPRYRALARYWREFPPVHVLLRALAGYRPPPEAAAPFDLLMSLAPGGTLNLAAPKQAS